MPVPSVALLNNRFVLGIPILRIALKIGYTRGRL